MSDALLNCHHRPERPDRRFRATSDRADWTMRREQNVHFRISRGVKYLIAVP
jgi:hypothetical protein